MIEEIKRSALGMAVIADWLGSGGQPVTPVIAERRSMACVTGNNGKPCPYNHGSQNGLNWWDWCKSGLQLSMFGRIPLITCEARCRFFAG